jgi:hypothetical protein
MKRPGRRRQPERSSRDLYRGRIRPDSFDRFCPACPAPLQARYNRFLHLFRCGALPGVSELFNVQVPSALLVIGYALKNIGIGYGE